MNEAGPHIVTDTLLRHRDKIAKLEEETAALRLQVRLLQERLSKLEEAARKESEAK